MRCYILNMQVGLVVSATKIFEDVLFKYVIIIAPVTCLCIILEPVIHITFIEVHTRNNIYICL